VLNTATGEYVRNAEIRVEGTTIVAYSEAMSNERIEYSKAFRFIGCPAQHIAAKDDGGDFQTRGAKLSFVHCVSRFSE
jgi:hypothetical protein